MINLNHSSIYKKELLKKIKGSKKYKYILTFIQKKPITSFVVTLIIFLLVLFISSQFSGQKLKDQTSEATPKKIKVFTVGKTPTITLQAQVKRNGIIEIVSQGAGIVSNIYVKEGESVYKGQTIISLSTNYQGGSAPALQAQLAAAQVDNINQTYTLQKDILSKQHDIATASAENTEQLRRISSKSLTDTKGLLDLNQSNLDQINSTLSSIDPTDSSYSSLKAQQVQLQAAVDQLKSSVRSVEYSTDSSNPPTLLANTQKDLTIKQLDVQEKALDLNKKVSSIQYSLALVQQGLMNPSSPFKGTVQKINVQVGQNLSPGNVIAVISSSNITTAAVLRVPKQIADTISRIEPSRFRVDEKEFSLTPTYVSTVATDGELYTIIYDFPEGVTGLTQGEYIEVEVPVGYAASQGAVPYIPIDSIYQTQEEASVFLAKKNTVISRKVNLGDVYGDFVTVLSGLNDGDQVILNRNIIAGDKILLSE